jgi:acyl carrier protein
MPTIADPQQLTAKVIELAAAQVGADPADVTLETDFHADLNYDSLNDAELIMTLEDELDITIPDELAGDVRTVGQALALVRKAAS